jgi:hypothetical protein
MDIVLKKNLWKKNLTAPNPKIFYIYGGAILVFKGIFFQHLNQNICPPVDLDKINIFRLLFLRLTTCKWECDPILRSILSFSLLIFLL